MGKVSRSRNSRRDVTEIWVYIAEDNIDAADRLTDLIDDALARLSDHPGIGQMRDELEPGLRSYPVGKYVIFYRAVRGGIEVARILHGCAEPLENLSKEVIHSVNSA